MPHLLAVCTHRERVVVVQRQIDDKGSEIPCLATLLDDQRATKEIAYGITSLTPDRADAATLAGLVRGHWQVENALHRCRDVTFGEDASRARTGNLPAVLATVRNTVITALRPAGARNIAAARRWAAADPQHPIQLFTANANLDISSL